MTQEKLNQLLTDPGNKVTYMTSSPGTVEFHVLTSTNELLIILVEKDSIDCWNLGTPGKLAAAIRKAAKQWNKNIASVRDTGESIQGTHNAKKKN